MLAADPSLALMQPPGSYDLSTGGLLALALDLGRRLLPAFATPTRLPYGSINLRHGVAEGESTVVCTARRLWPAALLPGASCSPQGASRHGCRVPAAAWGGERGVQSVGCRAWGEQGVAA